MSQQNLQDKLKRHLSFLAQDENNLNLLLEISGLYQHMKDYHSAQKYLDKAHAIDRVACLAHQGLLHFHQGFIDKAKASFLEAFDHEKTAALRYNLGFLYFLNQEFQAAEEILSPLLQDDDNPEAQILMARLLHMKGEINEALTLITHVLAANQDNEEALGFLSLLYFDTNQEDLALITAKRALEINPHHYDAQVISIMTRLMTQDTTIEEIQNLLHHNPEDSRLWFALGNTYLAQNHTPRAITSFQKAIALYPDFYDAYTLLAWCHLLNDDLIHAKEIYDMATQLASHLSDAWGGLALTHALKQDFDTAKRFIHQVKSLDSECFLSELAQTICHANQSPSETPKHLIKTLTATHLPASKKLTLLLESINESTHTL